MNGSGDWIRTSDQVVNSHKVRLILLYGIRSVNAVSIKNLNRKIKCDKPLLELVVYDGLAALQCPAFLCYLAG